MSRNVIRAERIFRNRRIAVDQQRARDIERLHDAVFTAPPISESEAAAMQERFARAATRSLDFNGGIATFVPFNKEDCPHV